MKLIKPSFEILEQKPRNIIIPADMEIGPKMAKQELIDTVYRQIEIAGRTCYRSEDKITDDSAKGFVDRMVNAGHCYTGDSEVLTIDGWKKWKDYSDEEVAVVNPDGTFKGFEIPKSIINKEYSGNFYNYDTLGMFANSSEDRYKDFEGELFICNTPYQDANKRHKTLGERWFKTQCVCNYSNIKLSPYHQLIGFWLGDGCRDTSKDRLRFHLKKDRKVEYLTELCLNLGYNFQYNNYHFDIKCSGIGEYFNSTFVRNSEKYINLNYTSNLDEIYSIIDGLLNSDGSFQKTGISFSSTSPYLIDYIYSKGPLVGFNVSVGKWKKELINNHKQVERLFILKSNNKIVNDSRKPDSKVIITNETLNVYCVTVSTGLILVKGVNGVISICGNCAMLEHGTVYLFLTMSSRQQYFKYCSNPYSAANSIGEAEKGTWNGFVTTNYRVLVENGWLDDLKYLCEPTEFHNKRITVKFITDQGILREFTRHRAASFAVESTRYCNYSKDKFGNELTFIIPCWADSLALQKACNKTITNADEFGEFFNEYYYYLTGKEESWFRPWEITPEQNFVTALQVSEQLYLELLNQGWKPQEARNVLPLTTKCEMVMTAFVDDWWGEYLIYDKNTGLLDQRIHGMFWKELDNIDKEKYRIVEKGFFPLRCSNAAHSQARELAIPLREEFIKRKYVK